MSMAIYISIEEDEGVIFITSKGEKFYGVTGEEDWLDKNGNPISSDPLEEEDDWIGRTSNEDENAEWEKVTGRTIGGDEDEE